MDQRLHLDDPARKQTYVTVMFDEIAPRYDAFTRWFSYGMDVVWKQELVRGITRTLTRQAGGRRGLDLACGTGDLARALAAGIPDLSIEGIDISPVMISRAEAHPQVTFRVGDATRLEAASGSVQLVTIGYGLRNFPDHRAALREIHRALAPHGVVGILEFTKPGFAPWRWLLLGYLWVAGMIFGWWWHRHGPVYGYIAHSIARFTTRKELVDDLAAAGFDLVSEKSHLGGGIAILIARKRS
jgi:demethylmenaquinone methyltransferase/2-methoxy-6-polyprenyl-1,4-benzoquinol methylase